MHQIVWLLGAKDTFSVMIKSDPSDNVTEWIQLVSCVLLYINHSLVIIA